MPARMRGAAVASVGLSFRAWVTAKSAARRRSAVRRSAMAAPRRSAVAAVTAMKSWRRMSRSWIDTAVKGPRPATALTMAKTSMSSSAVAVSRWPKRSADQMTKGKTA